MYGARSQKALHRRCYTGGVCVLFTPTSRSSSRDVCGDLHDTVRSYAKNIHYSSTDYSSPGIELSINMVVP